MSSDRDPGLAVPSIIDVIGGTPCVDLHRTVEVHGLHGRLLCKLEYLNPGLSKKDRVALEMIRDAKADGRLAEGQTVVELTSGNTGTGLAVVCAALGHPFVAVMSTGNSVERARMMRAFGAEVTLVDQAPGSSPGQVSGADLQLVEERAQRITAERQAFRADQFTLPASALAHERHTGPELAAQAGGADRLHAFVDFVGSSGSFTGIARALPHVRAYVVEPATAAAIAGNAPTNPNHRIQGGGYSMPNPPLFDRALVTGGFLTVTDDDAIGAARDLARREGVFAGFSTGACAHAALELLRTTERGNTVAFLAADSGLKYLSTELWPD